MPDTEEVQLQRRQVDRGEADALGRNADYDPHVHRQLPKPTNNLETLVHLLKCSIGTGILAMPQAFARAGLIPAMIGTVVVGVIITHCLHLIVRSQYAACKHRRVPLLTYPEAMTVTLGMGPASLRRLGRASAIVVDVFLVVYQLGVCCVYIVFIAANIKKFGDPYTELSLEIYMLFILGPLVLLNLIPSLKMLAPFSLFANLLTLLGLCIIVYYMFTLERSTDELDLWGSFETFPLFFGTMLFALTAVGVVVALENNMKTPKSFGTACGVLNTGMYIIVILYLALGVLGYVYCVSDCQDSITLNLPDGMLTSSMLLMYAVAIFISYGLQCYVPVEVVWRGYVLPRMTARAASPKQLLLAEYGVRVGLCILTFVLAAAVPKLGLFISLFGALCLSALGMCFPAVMDSCVAYGTASLSPIRFFKNAVLFVLGIMGGVIGTYTAMSSIIKSFE